MPDRYILRLGMTKNWNSKLEDMSIETSQTEMQRK